jgi:hypothetical protein
MLAVEGNEAFFTGGPNSAISDVIGGRRGPHWTILSLTTPPHIIGLP